MLRVFLKALTELSTDSVVNFSRRWRAGLLVGQVFSNTLHFCSDFLAFMCNERHPLLQLLQTVASATELFGKLFLERLLRTGVYVVHKHQYRKESYRKES